ncbi:tyrosine-type recombinase/integrase, partial [Streptococcus danieliae]|nr:tyrosine-type recombinase/integrase [Streptococcus danieliae]
KKLDTKAHIIFANTFNDYYNYNNLKTTFKKYLGCNIQFHIFRHTHASLCIEAGVPLELISKRLGHNSEKITKEIYIHKTKKMEQLEFEQFKNISF